MLYDLITLLTELLNKSILEIKVYASVQICRPLQNLYTCTSRINCHL